VDLESKVTIAILNWNGLKHLQQYLPSVVEHSGDAAILLIDNASTDQSIFWVKSAFPNVQISVLSENLGFTGGYNEGLKSVETEYVVLLNSDVEVTPGWLNALTHCMDGNPKIAACQPKILAFQNRNQFEYAGASGGFIDFLGYPFCRGRLFDHCENDHSQYDTSIPVFWASGACMMVRTSLFREFGGFEARFFAHMEEIDLCWRWLHSGFSIYVAPQSVVFHLGAGTLSKSSPRKTFLNFRNGVALLYSNTLDSSIWWKLPIRLVLDGVAGIQFLLKGESANCWAISKAHINFYQTFRYWSAKRKSNQKRKKASISSGLIIQKSVVWARFVMGKKMFSDL